MILLNMYLIYAYKLPKEYWMMSNSSASWKMQIFLFHFFLWKNYVVILFVFSAIDSQYSMYEIYLVNYIIENCISCLTCVAMECLQNFLSLRKLQYLVISSVSISIDSLNLKRSIFREHRGIFLLFVSLP